MVNAAAYSEQQLTLFDECDYAQGGGILGSLCGRTSQVLFHPTGGRIFKPCLKKSEKVKFQCLKGCHNAALRDSIFSYMTTYAALGMFLVMESVSVAIGQLIVEFVETERKR